MASLIRRIILRPQESVQAVVFGDTIFGHLGYMALAHKMIFEYTIR